MIEKTLRKKIMNYDETEELNCPNCGSPIKHRYNHNCPYCGTFFDYRIRETEEIDPRYCRDMRLREIESVPYELSYVMIFEGTYAKWSMPLEYREESIVMAKMDLPKKICFGIRISEKDYQELIRGNIEFIQHLLPFEVDTYNFIKALTEYSARNHWYG